VGGFVSVFRLEVLNLCADDFGLGALILIGLLPASAQRLTDGLL
jgi:hypothetical protein